MGQALVGPWAVIGWALLGSLGHLRALRLWPTLGSCGAGPCGPPWASLGRALLLAWALMGQALMLPQEAI